MMLRLVFSAALLAGATSAVAEDWRLVETTDSAPERTAGLIDYDSVDRSDAQFPKAKTVLLFETPQDGLTRIITTMALDCAGKRFNLLDVETRDDEGKVEAEAVERSFEAIEAGSPVEVLHNAVCDNVWSTTTETGKKPLDAVAAEVFGS